MVLSHRAPELTSGTGPRSLELRPGTEVWNWTQRSGTSHIGLELPQRPGTQVRNWPQTLKLRAGTEVPILRSGTGDN
ncbi:hypothetical protein CBR_g652 [Chara braunii]|uniref:Uncharacterized protein n=1 Tax=Chara braunii TaxID=69332 RepID=A0A388KBT3_CHABU|nr:hypothetical protein CBR_g652 [Chara braunii]|eukprot:GBG67522.1 hypothetical protein CBR_g652 [Chara braunii]